MRETDACPSEIVQLDAQLPCGGWPAGSLTELIGRAPGIMELRLLVPMMRRLTRSRRSVILIGAPGPEIAAPAARLGAPHTRLTALPTETEARETLRHALAAFGVDPRFLTIVRTSGAANRLWEVEPATRAEDFGALVGWLPQDLCPPGHLRRIQALAARAHGPVLLFRPLCAQFASSPAALRLLLLQRPGEQMLVQLLKRRGPVCSAPFLVALPQPVVQIRLGATEGQSAEGRWDGTEQRGSRSSRIAHPESSSRPPPARSRAISHYWAGSGRPHR